MPVDPSGHARNVPLWLSLCVLTLVCRQIALRSDLSRSWDLIFQETYCCWAEIKQLSGLHEDSVCFTSRMHPFRLRIVVFVCDEGIFLISNCFRPSALFECHKGFIFFFWFNYPCFHFYANLKWCWNKVDNLFKSGNTRVGNVLPIKELLWQLSYLLYSLAGLCIGLQYLCRRQLFTLYHSLLDC